MRKFEARLNENLQALADDLYNRTYKAQASTCFLLLPIRRNAKYSLQFSVTGEFIISTTTIHTNSLSGLLFRMHTVVSSVVERTTASIACSSIYGRRAIIIAGRAMSSKWISAATLCTSIASGYWIYCLHSLRKMATHRVLKRVPLTWQDKIDMDFVEYLTREIVLLDPTIRCRLVGDKSEWIDLPYDKSLYNSSIGCGLPIGNLTSQLFSNVYLNVLDQYMKCNLHCRHYGRYVDDFYVVSADRVWLRSIVALVRAFLQRELQLTLHDGKAMIYPVQYGVSFLGMFLKPWRMTVSRDSILRMQHKQDILYHEFRTGRVPLLRVATAFASFRGILSHGYNTRELRRYAL